MNATTSPRKRVLQVGPLPPPTAGGIGTYLGGLLGSPLAEQYELPVFDVVVPEASRKHRLLRWGTALGFLRRFRRRLRHDSFDLVHIHTSAHMGFWEKAFLARLAQRAGLPYVLHLHGGDFDAFVKDLSGWRRSMAGRIFAGAAGVVVLSQAWRPLFTEWVADDRLHVVPNAIDVPRMMPRVSRQQGPVRILFVGMISARKGLDELARAVANLVADDVRQFHVDLVGGEEFFGEAIRYRKLFRKRGVDDWVTFHGAQYGDDRDVFFREADISVLPSRSESFGIVNLEAMGHAIPVVSTRTGAIPEYIDDGEQGLLFEPGDAAGLTQALRQLIEDPEARLRMGMAARERAQRYDWKVLWKDLDHVYRCALGMPEPEATA